VKFLAIDPSSTVSGYAVFEDDTLLAWGEIDTKKVGYSHRFSFITGELEKLYAKHGFTEVACERAIRFAGRRVAALEVAVQGIKGWAKENKLSFVYYSPSSWKRSVVGKGNADKETVAEAAHLIYKQLPRVSSHITDAVAIGSHHLSKRNLLRLSKERE